MRPRHAKLVPALILASVALLASPAPGQTAQAPRPADLDPPSPLGTYAVGILLAGGALALSAYPSKRTHED